MRFTKFIPVVAILAVAASVSGAQPVIDGVINPGEGYTLVGTRTGTAQFGNEQTVNAVYVHDGPTTLSIFVDCNSSYNNHIAIYGDVTGRAGSGSGTVPNTPGAGSISGHTGMVTPLSDIDFAISANSGDDNNGTNGGGNDASCYVDFAAYGPQTTGFLGTDAVTDRARDTSRVDGTFTFNATPRTISFGYSDGNFSGTAGSLPSDGFEIGLPKAMFGSLTSANTIRLFVMMTSGGGYVSGSTIPSSSSGITGGQSPHYGNGTGVDFTTGSANGGTFTAITAGTTAVPLPVSMSEFAVE